MGSIERPCGRRVLALVIAATLVASCSDDPKRATGDVADAEVHADTGGVDVEGDTADTRSADTTGTDTAGTDLTADSAQTDSAGDTSGTDTTPPTCVIRVCPSGCDATVPSEAAGMVQDGCLVEIVAGDYVDCTAWSADNLTIRGVEGRPHIRDKTCAGKAIFITQAAHTTIENIEFSGMAVADRNGAAIRHEGGVLTVRGTYMHDGEEGILAGSNAAGEVHIDDATFERLGQDGQAHGIYINVVRELTVRNSRFLRSVNQGHELKSRAERSVIECNVIASLDGDDSRNIDLPNGGEAIIRRNVIQQGLVSPQRNLVGFALENQSNAVQSLTIEGNLFINDQDRGTFVQVAGTPALTISGNTFVGAGEVLAGQSVPPGNTIFATRAEAGFPSAPDLPAVPCP